MMLAMARAVSGVAFIFLIFMISGMIMVFLPGFLSLLHVLLVIPALIPVPFDPPLAVLLLALLVLLVLLALPPSRPPSPDHQSLVDTR